MSDIKMPPLPAKYYLIGGERKAWDEADMNSHFLKGYEAGRAAVQANVPDGWRPIETAPENLEELVAVQWLGSDGALVRDFDYTEDGCWMQWHNHAEHVEIIGGHGVSYTAPYTHWMPLPAAPGASAPPVAQKDELEVPAILKALDCLNSMVSLAGGENGPSIQLRAAIIQLSEMAATAPVAQPAEIETEAEAEPAEPTGYLVEGEHLGKVFAKVMYFTLDEAKSTASVFSQHYPTVHTKPLYTGPVTQAKPEQAQSAEPERTIHCYKHDPDEPVSGCKYCEGKREQAQPAERKPLTEEDFRQIVREELERFELVDKRDPR